MRVPSGLLGCALCLVLGCGDAPRPRHALLVSIDTLRPDHLGSYGYPRDTSPTLDALARQGVLFEDASSTSPWTLPAHASLLTGLYPSRHAVKERNQRLADDVPTLPELLADAGFRTGAIVNSHNLTARYGLERGFERHQYVNEWSDPQAADRHIVDRGAEITDRALAWLDESDPRRFFLFVHYYDVHSDYAPDPAYRRRFERPYDGPVDGSNRQLVRLRAQGELSRSDARHLVDLYDAEIRQLDAEVARLLAGLEARGLADRTLVVVTSDHGEELGERGSVLHGRTYFQEVIAVPLVLRGPGVPRGRRVATPVSLVDVTPTLLAALGVAAPAGLDGRDLSALWSGGAGGQDRAIFAEADHNRPEGADVERMVRAGRHKLVYDRRLRQSFLFDLETDSAERSDVASREPGRVRALLGALDGLDARARTPTTIPAPSPDEQQRLRELGYIR